MGHGTETVRTHLRRMPACLQVPVRTGTGSNKIQNQLTTNIIVVVSSDHLLRGNTE